MICYFLLLCNTFVDILFIVMCDKFDVKNVTAQKRGEIKYTQQVTPIFFLLQF